MSCCVPSNVSGLRIGGWTHYIQTLALATKAAAQHQNPSLTSKSSTFSSANVLATPHSTIHLLFLMRPSHFRKTQVWRRCLEQQIFWARLSFFRMCLSLQIHWSNFLTFVLMPEPSRICQNNFSSMKGSDKYRSLPALQVLEIAS